MTTPTRRTSRPTRPERYPDAFICAVEDDERVRAAESPMLRFPRRAVARFVALLRSDVAGIRAGFFALLISSGGDLVTGLTLASITHTLTDLAGLFILIPAAIGMRGNIFGALAAAPGTRIPAGTFGGSPPAATLFARTSASPTSLPPAFPAGL